MARPPNLTAASGAAMHSKTTQKHDPVITASFEKIEAEWNQAITYLNRVLPIAPSIDEVDKYFGRPEDSDITLIISTGAFLSSDTCTIRTQGVVNQRYYLHYSHFQYQEYPLNNIQRTEYKTFDHAFRAFSVVLGYCQPKHAEAIDQAVETYLTTRNDPDFTMPPKKSLWSRLAPNFGG